MRPAFLYKPRRRSVLARIPAGRRYRFPERFLFGAATSSHQVEGGDTASDWWRYERLDGRVRNFFNYPEFAQHWKSDHWRRAEDDVRRMKEELGLGAYRLSIEWSRIEPHEGQLDRAALGRYVALCAALRAAGIRPCVTLFHWSSPDWIWDHAAEQETGWYEPGIVGRFARFCEAVVPALAPHVDFFCTLNEPNIFLYGGFSEGLLAPGHRRSDRALLPVLNNLLEAHVRAQAIIKRVRADAEVGIAHSFGVFEAASSWNPVEALLAAQVEQQFTWSLLDACATGTMSYRTRDGGLHRVTVPGLAGSLDFIGVNYYERAFVRVPALFDLRRLEVLHDHHGDKEIWPREIYTRGFLEVLEAAGRRYGKPLYVTENGRAHPDDRERAAYLREHLRTLGFALTERGLDVRGYFVWSLLDNQEWAHGFRPRLGLFEVDYETGARRLRPSGRAYAELLAARAIET
ncbi:MAG TPA: family 1 glycosylhydrolase [Polyangia bacterium]|nr:family 1 glycosylhydrolase [Polyangia bacterium]